MFTRFVHTLVALALATGLGLAQAGPYTITVMDLPGATGIHGWDINNLGDFVGSATVNGAQVGFIRNAASTVTLAGPAGALGTAALGISDTGIVVGSYFTALGGFPNSGFIYSAGSYATLNFPGADSTQLRGISADGRYVTGYANHANRSSTAFVYDRSVDLFSAITTNPGLTIAQGVTNAGLVVGHRRFPGPARRVGFTYDIGAATLSDFVIAGAFNTSYRGISETGVIDGWFTDANGLAHGFVGSAALYELLDVPGAVNTYLEGINDAGWVSGSYDDAAGVSHAFLARPVLEPASWALLLAAFGGLVLVRRQTGRRT